MKKTSFQGNSKKPEIEVNKPPEQKNRPVLDILASELEEKEVLSGEEVKSIIEKPQT